MAETTGAAATGGWLLAAALLAGVSQTAAAQPAPPTPLTIANFGGANGQAQAVAFIEPFSKMQGSAAVATEYNGDLAPIREMVKQRRANWDVVEVESTDLALGCEAGLFEKINREEIVHASLLLPGTLQDCGVGAFVWSTVLAFDARRLKEAPKSWADFWDVKRFPGKRALRKGARYNLEIALMADGVPRRDVYTLLATEAGQARALAKLAELLPQVSWWESGAQPPQLLASGAVVMATAFNGRIAAANKAGARLEIAWTDAIYEFDYWAIVKGSPRRAQALAFINHASSEAAQLAFSREIPYGPTHFKAIMRYEEGRQVPVRTAATAQHAVIDLSMTSSDLPSAPANFRKSLAFNPGFWTRNGASIEQRFAQQVR